MECLYLYVEVCVKSLYLTNTQSVFEASVGVALAHDESFQESCLCQRRFVTDRFPPLNIGMHHTTRNCAIPNQLPQVPHESESAESAISGAAFS